MRTPFFTIILNKLRKQQKFVSKRTQVAGARQAARESRRPCSNVCLDVRFVTLDEYLCEARSNPTGGLEKLSSFEEFLVWRFTESRRNAYT
jgi:hypothetical protein